MRLLKRFDEPLFSDVSLVEKEFNKHLSKEKIVSLLNEVPSSHYRDYVIEEMDKVSGGFICPVENKYISPTPQVLVHGVYFKHINPSHSGIVDSFILPVHDISKETKTTIEWEIYKAIRSIRKPSLRMLSDDVYNWLNKILFGYSSRLLKVDFTLEKNIIIATVRLVNPGEVNPDITILCRRDGRFKEHYQDLVAGSDMLEVHDIYLKANGFLNIRQVKEKKPLLVRGNIMSRVEEMKNTGYPNYATLQNGIATLSNFINTPTDLCTLTSLERSILNEACDYTPWVRRY